MEKKEKLFEALQIELQDKRDILEIYRDVFKKDKLTQNQIIKKIIDDIDVLNKELEKTVKIEEKPVEKEIEKIKDEKSEKSQKEKIEKHKNKIKENIEITNEKEEIESKKSSKKYRK